MSQQPGDKLDANSIGLKSEIEFLRDLADILCPPDGVSPQ